MKISDITKKKYLSFESDETLSLAAKKLAAAGVSEAPVTEKRKYIGMFSTSDLARVLVRESVFGKGKVADFSKAKGDPIIKHMHHFSATIGPDADIISAYLVLLHKNVDVIPVVGKNKMLVGVALASDLREEMAKMLSEDGTVPKRQPLQKSEDGDYKPASGNTALDMVLHYVQAKGTVTAEEVSAKFKIPVNEIEEFALSLDKHGLVKAEYGFLGKMTLKRVE
jgi:CBS domain-containing protein